MAGIESNVIYEPYEPDFHRGKVNISNGKDFKPIIVNVFNPDEDEKGTRVKISGEGLDKLGLKYIGHKSGDTFRFKNEFGTLVDIDLEIKNGKLSFNNQTVVKENDNSASNNNTERISSLLKDPAALPYLLDLDPDDFAAALGGSLPGLSRNTGSSALANRLGIKLPDSGNISDMEPSVLIAGLEKKHGISSNSGNRAVDGGGEQGGQNLDLAKMMIEKLLKNSDLDQKQIENVQTLVPTIKNEFNDDKRLGLIKSAIDSLSDEELKAFLGIFSLYQGEGERNLPEWIFKEFNENNQQNLIKRITESTLESENPVLMADLFYANFDQMFNKGTTNENVDILETLIEGAEKKTLKDTIKYFNENQFMYSDKYSFWDAGSHPDIKFTKWIEFLANRTTHDEKLKDRLNKLNERIDLKINWNYNTDKAVETGVSKENEDFVIIVTDENPAEQPNTNADEVKRARERALARALADQGGNKIDKKEHEYAIVTPTPLSSCVDNVRNEIPAGNYMEQFKNRSACLTEAISRSDLPGYISKFADKIIDNSGQDLAKLETQILEDIKNQAENPQSDKETEKINNQVKLFFPDTTGILDKIRSWFE